MGPQAELLRWYKKQGRDLPWRQTRDPYRILLSEVMLQQTQVERVITYYNRFLDHYPTEEHLVTAPIAELHRLWQGLGYPSRIERLQATCNIIITEHQGIWPQGLKSSFNSQASAPTPAPPWQPLRLAKSRQWSTPTSHGFIPVATG